MSRITVLGGTGYAGGHIVQVAAGRGHVVTSYSRKPPDEPAAGVDYRIGDVQDHALLQQAVEDADVIVSALSPRGELQPTGLLRRIEQEIAELAQSSGDRFGVIGGAGSLFVFDGGPRVVDAVGFPEAVKPESNEMAGVLDDLRVSDPALDWFFVSPAGGFGAQAPGEALGHYRVGGDVLLVDEHGDSNISGADLGLAVVEEIEKPSHRRTRFTVAY